MPRYEFLVTVAAEHQEEAERQLGWLLMDSASCGVVGEIDCEKPLFVRELPEDSENG